MPEVAEQLELKTELANEIEVLADKLAEAQNAVVLLKAQLDIAKTGEVGLESDLLKMLDLADKNGKWMADVRSRLLKISAWSQRKPIPYKQMYKLVYSKLASQIKNVVDKELEVLKEKAGEARRVEISVLKKGGSLWSTLVKAWDKVKDTLSPIVHSIIDTLSSMLGARGEIDSVVTEMESLLKEDVREVQGCAEIVQKLGLKNIDCKNIEVVKVIARISKLGNSMAEQQLKKLLLSKLSYEKNLVAVTWEYGYLTNKGILVNEEGHKLLGEDVKFRTVEEADQYVTDKDYRISVVDWFRNRKNHNKKKIADTLSNIQIGDFATVDISKVKDYDSHEPYIKLVQREVRRGGGKVRIVSLRGEIVEISGLTSGLDILGGIWIPINSLRKVEVAVPSIGVPTSVDEIPIVAKILNSKKAEVNGVYVEASSEEEMLTLLLDEIEKTCNCGIKAEDIMTAAVEDFKNRKKSKSNMYSWNDVELWYNDVYILGERYGTEEEFYNDIDIGKIVMMDNPEDYQGMTAKKKQAVAPPGWEETVKKLKKYPEIENPWALAWYLKGEGYEPKKKSKKTAQEIAVEDVASDVGDIVSDVADKVGADVKDAADMIQDYIEGKLDEGVKVAVDDPDVVDEMAIATTDLVDRLEDLVNDLVIELNIDKDTALDMLVEYIDMQENDKKTPEKNAAETYMTSGDDKSVAVVDDTGKTQIKDKGTGAVKEDRTYANPAEAVSKLTGEGWKT